MPRFSRSAGDRDAEPTGAPRRLRAANSTILLVTGIAAFVQSAGSIGESFGHAAVAALGIALAVVAGWLQLPVTPRASSGTPAPEEGAEKKGEEPSLGGQVAVTAFLLLTCYLLVFLAGLVTVDYSAYRYESGTRPADRSGGVGPGATGDHWEWSLTPGARTVTDFRRVNEGSRDEMRLLAEFFVTSCGALDWTLSTDGARQLSRGTIGTRTRQRVQIPLPDRERSTTLRLTLERTDTERCTAVIGSWPFWAVGRPRIPLPGLETYLEAATP